MFIHADLSEWGMSLRIRAPSLDYRNTLGPMMKAQKIISMTKMESKLIKLLIIVLLLLMNEGKKVNDFYLLLY